MRSPSLTQLTPLTYSTFVAAFILIALSIAEIALTAKSLRAFRHLEVQYPGSSLAEWKFVNMNPSNIDSGPTTANFAVGTCSLASAVLAMLWIVLLWCRVSEAKMKKMSIMSCIATVANIVSAIGFLIYVFVREGANEMPQYFMHWQNTVFTREYYLCEAFPTIFVNADTLYGFQACDVAQAAKFLLIGISCLSVIVAGLVIMQAQKIGAFRSRERWDSERGLPKKPAPRNDGLPTLREQPRKSKPRVGSTRVQPPRNVGIQNPSRVKLGGASAARYS